MSYCKEEGKDRIIFVTEEDHNTPSTVVLPEDEDPVGLMKEDGSLNWNCPCLGGMATGPCGVDFREAFTCFHYSQADPKGSDCLEPFRAMSSCMAEYPGVYGSGDDNVMAIKDEDDDDEDLAESKHRSSSSGKDEDSGKQVENVAAVKDSKSQETKS